MKTVKVRGIVLKEYETGESDKRLVLLCKEQGRLTVYAKGARKPKSKFMAAAQLFTYADFVLADGRNFYSLTQADVLENFYAIRSDYDTLCYAHLMTEICEKTILENSDCDALLLLLLKSLSHISKKNGIPVLQVYAVFLFRFYLFYGISPQVHFCCVCNHGSDGFTGGLFFYGEGLICNNCAAQVVHRISLVPGTVAAMRYILESGLAESFLFNANEVVLRQLTQAGRLYWGSHFDWKLKSEAFT